MNQINSINMTRLLGIFILTIFSLSLASQDAPAKTKEKFKVYGNCGMCKKIIDEAAESVEGVSSASWNVDTKKITVKYNSEKTDIETIKKAIANVGYDTEEYRANDKTYDGLHGCCKYDRPAALSY